MKHTPGPWFWDVRPSTKTFRLCSPVRGTLLVMDFVRWGMQSGQPRFSDRNGERLGGIMLDGSKIDIENHPDARLIAAAPELLEACKKFAALETNGNNFWIEYPDVISQVLDVIAKAEGE